MRRLPLLAILCFALLCAGPALADYPEGPERPDPWVFIKARVGVQFFPLGVMGEVSAVPQTALARKDSLVLKRTYVGGGGYLRITPSFLDVGPRFSIRPVDLFEFHATGVATLHYPTVNGRVPFDVIAARSYDARQVHPHENLGAAFTLGVRLSPVLKLQLGPVIAVYGATFNYHHMFLDVADDQLIYDAALDLLLHKSDWTIEHQAALMAEVLDGDKTAVRLRLGGTVRQRLSLGTLDETLNAGFIGMVKPGRKKGWPEVLVVVMPYIRDTDRVLGGPWMFLGVTWEFQERIGGAADEVAQALGY